MKHSYDPRRKTWIEAKEEIKNRKKYHALLVSMYESGLNAIDVSH